MAASHADSILRHIRRLAVTHTTCQLSDAQLVQSFVVQHDEEAFAALLQRHGGLVWSVCRHVLRREHDAEDAFQATFLVLARSAASIRKPEAVASWLHGVAHRIAVRAKQMTAKRKDRECRAVAPKNVSAPPDLALSELQALLDEEVARLPEKYRAPFVLCCLLGRCWKDAAAELGWKEGTLSTRLAQARRLLQERLTRRGLTLSAALTAGVLGSQTASATLVQSTLQAALFLSSGRAASAVVTRSVADLVAGGMQAMTTVKLKVATGLLLAASLVVGVGLAVRHRSEEEPNPSTSPSKASGRKPATDLLGDPLPPGVLLRLGSIRLRHEGTLRSVAFSPDGKFLVSGGWNPTLRFWDPTTGKELRRLAGPAKGVNGIVFSRDGKRLAGAGADGIAYIWDVDSGRELRHFAGHRNGLNAVAFSPRGDRLASGDEAAVRVWDVATGQALHTFEANEGGVWTVAFSPDGKTVAGGGNATMGLWDADSGKLLYRSRDKVNPVQSMVFSRDGKTIVTTGEETTTFWNATTGEKLGTLSAHDSRGAVAGFSPDGKVLAVGCYDRAIRLWDWETKKELRKLHGHPDGVKSLTFSPDGKTLASGSAEEAIHVWDLTTGKPIVVGTGHQERLTGVAYAPDGRTITTAAWDGTVRLWDARKGRELGPFEAGHGKEKPSYPLEPALLSRVAFSPRGKQVAAVRGDETVVVWDIASGKEVQRFRGGSVAFSPDAKLIAIGGWGTQPPETNMGVIRLFDAGGKLVRELRGHKTTIASLAFSADGKTLVSRGYVLEGLMTGEPGESESKFVRFWEVATGKERRGLPAQTDLHGAVLSPDGRTLATCTVRGKAVTLLETASGQPRAELTGHTGMIFDVVFAPDGCALATAGMDGTIRLWDVLTGKEIGRLAGHRSWVLAVAFAPDGRTLVSGGIDTTALVWDVSRFAGQRPSAVLEPKELDAHWQNLIGNAKSAHESIIALVGSSKETSAFLHDRLQPAQPLEERRLAQLIAGLNSEQFRVRKQAEKELEALGDLVKQALRKVLAKPPSLEVGRRAERLLAKLEEQVVSSEQLRNLRAVEVLEHIATPEARQLLRKLAAGAPDARLTREAKASLERLNRWPAKN